MKCLVETCNSTVKSKGYCSKHYKQMWRHGRIVDGEKKVCGIGINDMPYGWSSNSTNKRIYKLWARMLERCYGDREDKNEYKDCEVSERWHTLSNFVNDIKLIDGYELWEENMSGYALDKDIKNGNLKLYSLENCMFVTIEENGRDGQTRSKNDRYVQGRNIKTGETICGSLNQMKELGFNKSHIIACCKKKRNIHLNHTWEYSDNKED